MTQDNKTPKTEVQPRAKRRTFTASYKHGILAEADQCQSCLEALNGQEIYYPTYADAIGNNAENPLPYVIDFTRLQRVQPRPFFCSAYSDPASNFDNPDTPEDDLNQFTFHNWYFYTMPDAVTISLDQLYLLQDWFWSSNDGIFPF